MRVMRLRPFTTDIFKGSSTRGWHIELQRQLDEGLNSVLDVDPEGDTALHVSGVKSLAGIVLTLMQVAVNHQNCASVEVLIRAGADKYQANEFGV